MVEGAETIGDAFSDTYLIRRELYNLTKQIILEEFEFACEIGNSEDGFPEKFQQHLLSAVRRIEPDILVDLHGAFIEFDLEEWLGSYEELQRAFHQGAKLAGGGTLDGPYDGQKLHQEDTEIRHIFWEALRFGQPKAQIGDKSVPVQGDWETTMDKYINIWGSKAPEWLFLQFGQEEWRPYVPQVDVLNNIENKIQATAGAYLAARFQESVAWANNYRTTGIDVGFSPTGKPRLNKGVVTIKGKTYKAGQFLPREIV